MVLLLHNVFDIVQRGVAQIYPGGLDSTFDCVGNLTLHAGRGKEHEFIRKGCDPACSAPILRQVNFRKAAFLVKQPVDHWLADETRVEDVIRPESVDDFADALKGKPGEDEGTGPEIFQFSCPGK